MCIYIYIYIFINNSLSCKGELDLYGHFLNMLQATVLQPSNSKSFDHKNEISNPLILSGTI